MRSSRAPLLQPFQRVTLVTTIFGEARPQVLMDGFITHQQMVPSGAGEGSTFTVTGEDVSVMLDLDQVSQEWPNVGDAANVFAMLEAGSLLYPLGLHVDVDLTLRDVLPFFDQVPQQNGSVRGFVQQLAQQNGYVFYVKPGSAPGHNVAYWGPPQYSGEPQPALTVNMGPETNVESVQCSFSALTPTDIWGWTRIKDVGIGPITEVFVPLKNFGSTRDANLASRPALDTPPHVRRNMFQHQGEDVLRALAQAQAIANQSTDSVVTVEGTLDTVRYGHLLDAPGIVGLRGAGGHYDGKYYLKSVRHNFSLRTGNWDCKQSFTLTREGLGTTVQEVRV